MIEMMVCTVERIIINPEGITYYLSGWGPTIAAGIAALVAWNQFRLLKKQHNFNLLQKRIQCKENFTRLLRELPTLNELDQLEQMILLSNFMQLTKSVKMLYNKKIASQLNSLYNVFLQNKDKMTTSFFTSYLENFAKIYKDMEDFIVEEKCS